MEQLHAPYRSESVLFGANAVSGSARLVLFIGALAVVGGSLAWWFGG
ncbi:hypothetical protein [Rhodoligotrophos defluvii]|nr:hypothetical protein [Rhodoligotrophos defluvii]